MAEQPLGQRAGHLVQALDGGDVAAWCRGFAHQTVIRREPSGVGGTSSSARRWGAAVRGAHRTGQHRAGARACLCHEWRADGCNRHHERQTP